MICVIAARRSISFHVSRPPFLVLVTRISALHSRVFADSVRPYTTTVPFPDHRLLRSLSRDELIDVCIEGQMSRLRDRAEQVWATAQEKDAIMKDKDVILEQKDSVLMNMEALLKTERDAVLVAIATGHKAELDRYLYMERYKSLRIQYLRQEDRFNLRGIIEYIASTNPNDLYGVQPNLNDLSQTPEFARCLNSILDRVILPRDRVLKCCKQVYGMLSKHSHRHSVRGNCPELVIDTTPGHSQVFAAPDGAALEAFLQLGRIPYLTIYGDQMLRFDVVGAGQLMVGEEMPPGYERKSWLDKFHVFPGDLSKMDAEPPMMLKESQSIAVGSSI